MPYKEYEEVSYQPIFNTVILQNSNDTRKFCFSTVKIENSFEHFFNNVLGTKNNVVEFVSNGLVDL